MKKQILLEKPLRNELRSHRAIVTKRISVLDFKYQNHVRNYARGKSIVNTQISEAKLLSDRSTTNLDRNSRNLSAK